MTTSLFPDTRLEKQLLMAQRHFANMAGALVESGHTKSQAAAIIALAMALYIAARAGDAVHPAGFILEFERQIEKAMRGEFLIELAG